MISNLEDAGASQCMAMQRKLGMATLERGAEPPPGRLLDAAIKDMHLEATAWIAVQCGCAGSQQKAWQVSLVAGQYQTGIVW